ncbi:hypothetical protein [Rheinheimera sp. F8]|uniref:hypothetical protein n=1 Tax=Rheinheimera sp. F8 TaxID=1763998 RepID=UPI00074483D0|nr:hypothetical protein [Rheinheimera sp. F8]ALZ75401.1 hypothetical protein ATY27_06295 [Rheinheimera sp. F8]ALZ75785.1 hypothetical protein ATY27_08410 [Rheinheimera sp. F8]
MDQFANLLHVELGDNAAGGRGEKQHFAALQHSSEEIFANMWNALLLLVQLNLARYHPLPAYLQLHLLR